MTSSTPSRFPKDSPDTPNTLPDTHDPSTTLINIPPFEPASSATTPSRKDRKGKGREKEGFGHVRVSSPIASLPLELLAHVFAHLLPYALGTCQLVCRAWHDVVVDEASWRTAFETYYGVTPDSLGRRIEPSSWRSEYISRVSLLRHWHRARTPTVIHNPSLGALSHVHINLPSVSSPVPGTSTPPASPRTADSASLTSATLLSLSLDMGAAVHSSPFTGKVSKRPLFASPVDHLGRPLGLPIVSATSVGVSIDGTKIVWGMRDGSLRFVNSSPTGGRGTAGGTIEAGEVRSLPDAHREGSAVQAVAFSGAGGTGGGPMMRGVKQRTDVFVTAGADGGVAIWSFAIPASVAGAAGVRDRPPVAVKAWQGRWDGALDAAPAAAAGTAAEAAPRRRVKATSIAFDSGWVGRYHGRPASVAVGRSDGKTVVWPAVYLDEEKPTFANDTDARVLPAELGGKVDYLVCDPPSNPTAPLSLLTHQAESSTFSRFVFSATSASPIRTTFGHPQPDHLSALTAFAVDFDEAATSTASVPSTPAEGKISFHPRPRLFTPSASSSSLAFPSLSRSTSTSSIFPLSTGADGALAGSFGQRKYVAAGDKDGRVFLWNWEAKQSEEEQERGDLVPPSVQIQGLEIDGGGSASKVTALELTDAGVFVGGLDGTLRFYSTIGTAHLLQPPIRSFRDRTAPRHPSRMLAQGLIADDEENRWLVSHVRASREAVVAAIGGRILAWRTSSDVKKKGVKAAGGKLTARQERFKANMELQHQVRESINALSAESAARLERRREEERMSHDLGLPPTLDNMTEEEAVAYAMLLSMDEQEAKLFENFEDEPDWEQVPDEWLDSDGLVLDEDYERSQASTSALHDEAEDDDERLSQATSRGGRPSQSLSSSLSVPSSPFLGSSLSHNSSSSPASRGVSYNWKPVSPSLRALGSPPSSFNPHAKLHISPRLGPTYGSTGAAFTNDPIPDMSPELWPVASSPASPPGASFGGRRTSTGASSPLSPATTLSPSLAAIAAPSGTPVRRGWSEVARSAASTPGSASPSPASRLSTSPSAPTSWPSPPSTSSLLAAQLRQSELSAKADEALRRQQQEEEDLRYALELSMVEEASRLEI
uniref:BY PROTMAP: gi/472582866/gb/EMS20537.1/ F-box and WD repeat domain containing protein [Rhodosporidium toruloides NP11] gi/647402127/emb/CDR48435.1/ RHTO0S17e03532g1_1 [Rhodosporidium toruloides] n=1 Tax=Rhodotorula toruloides TaxID=5286 RepID=A0A0K3CT00_RHOTO